MSHIWVVLGLALIFGFIIGDSWLWWRKLNKLQARQDALMREVCGDAYDRVSRDESKKKGLL